MRQESFDFLVRPTYLVEDFIITNTNKSSFQRVCDWPDSWSHGAYPYFLLLHGDRQCGKTHLANIWAKKSNAHFLLSHQKDQLEKYPCVAVEDIDNKFHNQSDLLYIFNFCHEMRKYCLFTSQIFPIQFDLPDLSSRIRSINEVKIIRPDKETIKIILVKEFAKKALNIDSRVVDFLADVIPQNFDSAIDAVEILDKTSLNTGKNISYSLIKQIFLTK
jgi:chromosomal replication initiation ATPase DnaA